MTAPAAFRASYSDWKLIRTRSCVQVVFEIPLEDSDAAYNALGGMPNPAAEIWCGIARLDVSKIGGNDVANGEAVSSHPGQASPSLSPDKPLKERKPRKPEDRLKLRAALLCSAPAFWKYLNEKYNCEVDNAEAAASVIRHMCSVDSRREIIPGTPAGESFQQVYDRFHLWLDHPELVAS